VNILISVPGRWDNQYYFSRVECRIFYFVLDMWNIVLTGLLVAMVGQSSSQLTKCYDSQRQLAKGDFRGSVLPGESRKVFGDFGISFHFDSNGRKVPLEICAYFNPYRSYCKSDAPDKHLKHENYRWLIYHLAKLEMIETYKNRVLDFSRDGQILLDDIKLKYAGMDRKYNVATKFGDLDAEELKWQAQLDSIYSVKRFLEDSIIVVNI
jgi:hypothetical protein